ncbi:LysR family transcriptional regulator [Salinicoccus sp. YB14-2]|uniref:LysR family transcriptional regulator n=1 Tax=Salinicoccus sp. YB14-2 TaxID=1572701 RepID=UPI00068FCB6A|nr:LysR family transcriptional regulator [Salinicoccus sp. YB14-2]
MEIKQLLYFTETARLQHMTEASLVLNVAQSALSRQIGLLENDLGIELFKREGRNIILTEEGKIFYEDAMKILEVVDKTKEKISESKKADAQTLNIHITKSDMTTKVLHSFQKLLVENPEIDFSIQKSDESTIEQKLLDHTLDIAVSTNKFSNENINNVLLFDQNYYYIFRESSETNLPIKASLNEFEDLSLVTLDAVMDIESQFKRSSVLNINDIAIIQYLLMHHNHVGILSFDETKILKHNYPNFVVHSLEHLNIRQPLYVNILKNNEKPFVHKLYNQLKNEFSTLKSRMMG